MHCCVLRCIAWSVLSLLLHGIAWHCFALHELEELRRVARASGPEPKRTRSDSESGGIIVKRFHPYYDSLSRHICHHLLLKGPTHTMSLSRVTAPHNY